VPITCLHDRTQIEAFLRQDAPLHLYELGDLDDFFWEYTTWYALKEGDGSTSAVTLVYTGTDLPVVLALARDPAALQAQARLLAGLQAFLPARFYSHFSPGLEEVLQAHWSLEPHGLYEKMALLDPARLERIDTERAEPLGPADLPALQQLYTESYPGNWFDPRMLETGHYYGVRSGSQLVSVAGIHVYSPRYHIGVLGNITTHPRLRGQGLGTIATGALCKALLKTVDTVGLNVRADNASAIACYQKLGFQRFAVYNEYMVTRNLGLPKL
jgi:ribosomal protein S18 acetylase RimI-like enzyme